jgi:hypothetical protein
MCKSLRAECILLVTRDLCKTLHEECNAWPVYYRQYCNVLTNKDYEQLPKQTERSV